MLSFLILPVALAAAVPPKVSLTLAGPSLHPVQVSGDEQEEPEGARLADWKLDFDEWLFVSTPSAELVLDQAARIVQTSRGGGPGVLSWIGLDFISDVGAADGRSIGTLTLQPYAIHAGGLPKTPSIFDGDHDWALQWRIFRFEVTRWAHQGVSWKMGHIEVPFGLERGINTNGTMRQFTNGSNLGVKGDWGTSLHGERNGIDYEVAVTRGSGNEYREEDGNRVIAARVGNSLDENLSFGVSFMDARLTGLDPPAGLTAFPKPDRTRLGADFRWRGPTFTLLGETSFGTNNDDDVWAAYLEASTSSDDERSFYYAQLIGSGSKSDLGREERETLGLGYRQHLSANSTLSLRWTQDLNVPDVPDARKQSVMTIQLRFRF